MQGPQKTSSHTRRRRWFRWLAAAMAGLLALLACVGSMLVRRAEPWLRARIVAELEQRFQARVELDSFRMWFSDGLWAEGKGLRIWPPASVEGIAVPGPGQPLIRLAEFRFHAPLHLKPGATIHISKVELKGLVVDLPPKTRFAHAASAVKAPRTSAFAAMVHFQVDALECAGGQLTLETSKPGKLPLQIEIARLRLTGESEGAPVGFEAELTNPYPVGQIHTTGTLGPWQVSDPGETPIGGQYRFEHADLGTIRGIGGTLASAGSYQGTLRDLTVDGATETPEFRLTHFGTALPLHTRFHAKVDATNGDTWLQPVEATLGRSHFRAHGQIVRVIANGQSIGHDVALTVDIDDGRIEDFLRLTSRSGEPLLTGALTMKAALDLPPGKEPVHRRMKLNGAFALDQALFTSDKIQGRIGELSARGLGHPKDAKEADAAQTRSAMHGSFTMASGILTLPDLEYMTPGAEIALHGAYGVDGGTLDFTGEAKLQATVSQAVGGWKGLLLKPVDRFFQRDGAGTVAPIHIRGTREAPDFGIDFNRFRSNSPQHPARQP